jgi:hypothetical protein
MYPAPSLNGHTRNGQLHSPEPRYGVPSPNPAMWVEECLADNGPSPGSPGSDF